MYVLTLVAAATMSLLALLELPYGFYQALRIVVCVSAIWVALTNRTNGWTIFVWVFAGMAILFNPIAKIHMERDQHAVFNVASALLFAAEIARSMLFARRELVAKVPE